MFVKPLRFLRDYIFVIDYHKMAYYITVKSTSLFDIHREMYQIQIRGNDAQLCLPNIEIEFS
jgi:hypothetical protein